jgi:hypothetical protein
MVKRAVLIAGAALGLPGCAHDAGRLNRHPTQGSTIGTDLNKAPAGRVHGPTGLGVDLTQGLDDADRGVLS